jgi:hypothetical protein
MTQKTEYYLRAAGGHMTLLIKAKRGRLTFQKYLDIFNTDLDEYLLFLDTHGSGTNVLITEEEALEYLEILNLKTIEL